MLLTGDAVVMKPTTTLVRAARTRMGPSSSRMTALGMSASEQASSISGVSPTKVLPVPRDDEPNLYNLPETLYPIYRPLPWPVRLIVAMLSMFVSAITTWEQRLNWLTPLMAIRHAADNGAMPNPRKIAEFLVKAISAALVANIALQDIFLRPSRIPTAKLFQNYFTPSKLSTYEPIALPSGDSLGVHFLKYPGIINGRSPRYRAVYVNHGFGASSLSWLPALPKLVDRLRSRVGLGHDAPGFGFTDRPRGNTMLYSIQNSAAIGSSLLSKELAKSNDTTTTTNSVLLLGHSMGAAATLRMALALPTDIRKHIILVAPALGLRTHSTTNRPVSVQLLADWTRPARGIVRRWLVLPIWSYLLRRLVGRKNFWRKGLSLAWGNANRLSDSDILRFQWPSIGLGWERGLLEFSRAQLRPPDDSMSDKDLLEKILSDQNATVAIVRGTADRVIPKGSLEKFLEPFADKNVTVIELDGQGHDPFEEQVDVFFDVVERILAEESNV